MSKKIHLIFIGAYIFLALYFAVFNWDVFIVSLNVSLGFAVINIPLIALLLLLGLLLQTAQWMFVNINTVKQERDLIKKDNELMALKVAFYDDPATGVKTISENLKSLQAKVDDIIQSIHIIPARDNGKEANEVEAAAKTS